MDITSRTSFAFYAPAHTPTEIVDRLEKKIIEATRAPDVHAKILAVGFQPTGTTAEELRMIQREEFDRWGAIVKASGFKAEK